MFEDVPPEPAPAAAAEKAPIPVPPAAGSSTTANAPPASVKAPAESTTTKAVTTTPPVTKPPLAEPPLAVRDDSIATSANGIAWRWPGRGNLIGTYVAGDQTRQGIDIAGNAGDPVMAAADGEVVYSGNGLLGYGELIIVKHSANFLSAYGHNRKRLVQEGERIKGGQQIAEMGSSASARDELHFEIRKNGKPVNPLDYLPAR
jgi:lipoprotein NlpD